MGSTSARVVEVIQIDGPDHGTSVAFAFHPVHFDLQRNFILVTDPLVIFERVGHFTDFVVLFGPSASRILDQWTNLRTTFITAKSSAIKSECGVYFIIGYETSYSGVRSRVAASEILLNWSSQAVLIGVGQCVRSSEETSTYHQFITWATKLFQHHHSVVLLSNRILKIFQVNDLLKL